MKYSAIFGALATTTMVSAAAYGPAYGPAPASHSVAPAPKSSAPVYVAPEDDDCDGYPMSEPTPKPSSKKVEPVPKSTTPCDEEKAKPSSAKVAPVSSKAVVKPISSYYKPVYPYVVISETIIIVVEEFTVPCHGPTTIIEEDETIIVTIEEVTTVTFNKGPYTRTKTHLECGPTTTEYFSEAPCPSGWPYVAGQGYTPLPVSYTPCPVYPVPAPVSVYPVAAATPVYAAPAPGYAAPAPAPAYGAPAPAPAPAVAAVAVAPSAAPSSGPVSPALFNPSSGASHTQAGVVALIAGVVAAMMVL